MLLNKSNFKTIQQNGTNALLLSVLLILLLVANAEHQSGIIHDAIRDPISDNAQTLFRDVVPNELEEITESAIEEMDDHGDSELLAEDTLFGIFDIVENDIFGDNLIMASEKFGDRIIQLVTNIFANAFEASFNILN